MIPIPFGNDTPAADWTEIVSVWPGTATVPSLGAVICSSGEFWAMAASAAIAIATANADAAAARLIRKLLATVESFLAWLLKAMPDRLKCR